jgi:hypothetical protein
MAESEPAAARPSGATVPPGGGHKAAPPTGSVSVNTAVPEQFPAERMLCGPYRLNVIVPVGLSPPVKVAVSVIVAVPTVPPALGAVAIAGEALLMVTDSAPQPQRAVVLLVSPP